MKRPNSYTSQYSIGEAARKLKISVETIRLYERSGLILFVKTKGNQRLVDQADIDRIICIRQAINEHKISIGGIRRMQSMVPCWDYVSCSEDQRKKCPAYQRPDAGCWTYNHTRNDCAGTNCRQCDVYQLSGDCQKIKSLIHHTTVRAETRRRSRGTTS